MNYIQIAVKARALDAPDVSEGLVPAEPFGNVTAGSVPIISGADAKLFYLIKHYVTFHPGLYQRAPRLVVARRGHETRHQTTK